MTHYARSQGSVILSPAEGTAFRRPGWDNSDEKPAATVAASLLSEGIYWFRQEGGTDA